MSQTRLSAQDDFRAACGWNGRSPFGALLTSKIIITKELGLGTAAAVLIDATIIRALLVPALMQLRGRWNWWAPAPLRRLHARIRLSET